MIPYELTLLMPVYNAAQFLEQTLQSLQKQSFQQWKLVIINDGSTDSSGQICDSYAQQDERIRVIYQENQGVAKTRNRLLMQIDTPYFSFVDADDELDSSLYQILMNHMLEKDVDLVMCGILEKKYIKDSMIDEVVRSYPTSLLILDEMQDSFMTFSNSLLLNSPCNKIYKTKIVKENSIEFLNVKTGEDILFNLEYLKKINCLYVEEKTLYYYMRRNVDSITVSYIDDLYEKGLVIHEATESFLETKGLLTQSNQQIIDSNHIKAIFAAFLNLHHKDCPLTLREKKEVIKSIISRTYVRECAIQNLDQKNMTGLTAHLIKMRNPVIILSCFSMISKLRILRKSLKF